MLRPASGAHPTAAPGPRSTAGHEGTQSEQSPREVMLSSPALGRRQVTQDHSPAGPCCPVPPTRGLPSRLHPSADRSVAPRAQSASTKGGRYETRHVCELSPSGQPSALSPVHVPREKAVLAAPSRGRGGRVRGHHPPCRGGLGQASSVLGSHPLISEASPGRRAL